MKTTRAKPYKLGLEHDEFLEASFHNRRTFPRPYAILLAFAAIAAIGGGVGVAVVMSAANSPSAEAIRAEENVTNAPTESPITPRPTAAPTGFPTRLPTAPTTSSPTQAPTVQGSQGGCTDPDAICGCDLVQSQLVDILLVVDESGSISSSNFNSMRNGIIEFVNSTLLLGDLGTRFGWIQFNGNVNEGEIIGLSDFDSSELLIDEINSKVQRRGTTDQAKALTRSLEYFQEPNNAFREGSQRVLIMFTDGDPCCSTADPDPVDELKDLALFLNSTAQPFTFFYLPIGFNININLFDGDNGLIEDETFIKLEVAAFSELSEKLNTELTIPLGPCITPPPTLQ